MLIALVLALSTEPLPVDRRVDLQRFSARLEQRLATACRPAEPMVFLSGLPETRFIYLDGVGAVFLLPPRALPDPVLTTPGQPLPEISVSAARPGTPAGQQAIAFKRPSDLTDLEARIRETRKEAERMRAMADAAFADAERQLMAEQKGDQAVASFAVPWTFFLEDAIDDTRPPEQVEKDVKDALITTILEDAALLKTLEPPDMVTVSVELVTRPQPWVKARRARTLIVRALKSDLDGFTSGKVTKEELLKRVVTKAY